jgi:hypothetical protein
VSDVEPEASPRRPRLGGWGGCLLWALAFMFVIAAGCSIGLVLRPDPEAPAEVASGQGWKVQVQNQDGEKCISLIIGNEERAGQCELAVGGEYRATSYEVGGGQVVIFGPVPENVERVRLRLEDGSRPVVPTDEKKDIRFFVHEATSPDQGPTVLLDEQGNEVTP